MANCSAEAHAPEGLRDRQYAAASQFAVVYCPPATAHSLNETTAGAFTLPASQHEVACEDIVLKHGHEELNAQLHASSSIRTSADPCKAPCPWMTLSKTTAGTVSRMSQQLTCPIRDGSHVVSMRRESRRRDTFRPCQSASGSLAVQLLFGFALPLRTRGTRVTKPHACALPVHLWLSFDALRFPCLCPVVRGMYASMWTKSCFMSSLLCPCFGSSANVVHAFL